MKRLRDLTAALLELPHYLVPSHGCIWYLELLLKSNINVPSLPEQCLVISDSQSCVYVVWMQGFLSQLVPKNPTL